MRKMVSVTGITVRGILELFLLLLDATAELSATARVKLVAALSSLPELSH